MALEVTVDGRSWLLEDLTLDELVEIEQEVGESWGVILDGPLKTAASGKAILVRLLAREHGMVHAAKLVGAMTFKEVVDAFEQIEADPKEQETTSSPSSPRSTSGPPT